MANNQYINKVEMADGRVLMDLTEDTITVGHMLAGTIAHLPNGEVAVGDIPTYNGDYTVTSNEL